MLYLSHFSFPDIETEYSFTMGQQRTCYHIIWRQWFRQDNSIECDSGKAWFKPGCSL